MDSTATSADISNLGTAQMGGETTRATTEAAAQINERRGWLGVLSVALGSFVLVLSEFLPIGLLPAIAADLDVSIGTAGFMIVSTGLVGAISAPIVTVATSRFDRRTVLLALTVLLLVADVLGALAPNFAVLLLARMLLGVAIGGFWAIGAGIASRLVSAPSVIRASSFITAGVSVATVVSLPLGSWVSAVASWRLAFVIGAGLGAVALVLQLMMLPSIPALQRVRYATLGNLLKVSKARVGLLLTAFVFAAQFTAYTYVAPYLEDEAHASAATVTIALLIFGMAGIVGNFVAGATLSRTVTGTLTIAKILLAVAVVLLPVLAHSITGVMVLLVIWGFMWGALPLGMQTWMSNSSPSGSESNLALFVTTVQLAIAGGSVIGGFAVSSFGLAFDFYLAGGFAALGVVVLLTFGRTHRNPPAPAGTLEPTSGLDCGKIPCPA